VWSYSFQSQHGAPRPSQYPPPRVVIADPRGITNEEAIFRKVRGVLNKLTIERFEPLVQQLLSVGINSENVLKVLGVLGVLVLSLAVSWS
jgi:hypothetical protein